MTTVERSLAVAAQPAAVWATLADFARIDRWAPNVDHSAPASTARDGEGAIRRVQVGRLALLETVTAWQPPRQLAYRVVGLPPVAGPITTTWRVEPRDAGSLVTVTTEVLSPRRPPGRIVGRVLSRRLAAAAEQMLHGLAQHTNDPQEQS